MNRLFVRLTETVNKNVVLDEFTTLANAFSWILLSDNSDVIESGANISAEQLHQRLEDKNLTYQDVIFFPPEHRVKVHNIVLAKGQHRHIEKITPYLLEEFFAQPPEDLHFTLLNKSNKKSVWVSVVAKENLEVWLSSLTSMGWRNPIILPIAGLLPFWPDQNDESAFLYACDEDFLLKNDGSVIYIPRTLLERLPKRESYQISCDKDKLNTLPFTAATELLPLSLWSNTRANDKGKMETWLFTLGKVIQNNKTMLSGNLCHGAYQQKNKQNVKLVSWLWVAGLAFFSLFTELYLTHKNTTELNQQASKIQNTSKAEFLKLVPDEGRVFHLKRQIESRIQRAKQDAGNGQYYSLYEVMEIVDQVRSQVVGQHRIVKLDFANNVFRLDWQAQERDTLDKVRVALQASPLNALMEQVTKRGERYVASIKITVEEQ